jgi:CheY-like chemotaxis protein
MTTGSAAASSLTCVRDHTLQFYESEDRLEEVVSEYLAEGLDRGDAVMVIASRRRAAALILMLDALGCEVERARGDGSLVFLDGSETLAEMVRAGKPDPAFFHAHLGAIVATLTAASSSKGPGRVRVYSELADALWRRGEREAAVRLEELWNEVAAKGPVSLCCPYVTGSFENEDDAESLGAICGAHTRIVPASIEPVDDDEADEPPVPRDELERQLCEAVAARERAEEELEQARRGRDELLADVAHQLRAPLAAIAGWAAVLKGGRGVDATLVGKAVDVIERNARAQRKIIDGLLDEARVLAGTLRLDRRPMSLSGVVSDVVDAARANAVARRIVLGFESSGDLHLVLADRDRLRQVVSTLVDKAIEAMPDGGRLAVRCRRQGFGLGLDVEPSGEAVDTLFRPREIDRVGAGRRARETLGLALARHLVELHGGQLVAEMGATGRGARFSLLLPLGPVTAATTAPEGAGHDPTDSAEDVDLGGIRVLLVDDEPDARGLLEDALRSRGAEVHTAGSAPDAFAKLTAIAPHVLVSDIGMPFEDGYSFLRRVREMPQPFRDTPAIALTSYDDVERATSAGYQRHFPKPADPATVASAIATMRPTL